MMRLHDDDNDDNDDDGDDDGGDEINWQRTPKRHLFYAIYYSKLPPATPQPNIKSTSTKAINEGHRNHEHADGDDDEEEDDDDNYNKGNAKFEGSEKKHSAVKEEETIEIVQDRRRMSSREKYEMFYQRKLNYIGFFAFTFAMTSLVIVGLLMVQFNWMNAAELYADAAGILGTILIFIQFLPQIYLTFSIRVWSTQPLFSLSLIISYYSLIILLLFLLLNIILCYVINY
jgi:hypothetical protein